MRVAKLIIHDPKVSPEQISKDLNLTKSQNLKNILITKGIGVFLRIERCINDADAALIVTEWPEYTKINWKMLLERMSKPAWVFDSRSIIDPKDINKGDKFLESWRWT